MTRRTHSIADARTSRDHRRLQSLQAEFTRRGFTLDPLTGNSLILQRWGLYRVLDSLEEAQRYLDQVGGAR